MAKTIVAKLLTRNDTAANWTSANPVLSKGEIGIETDTNKFKFGDGITVWNSLSYAGISLTDVPLASASVDGLMSKGDYSKLVAIEAQAQVNIIESIEVNSVALSITSKGVNIVVPTGALASKDKVAQTDFDTALTTAFSALITSTEADTKISTALASYYTKTEVDGKVTSVFKWKGTKATVGDLPSSDNTVGDVWHVTADNGEYAWNGTAWEPLGGIVDLSAYATKTYVDTELDKKISNTDVLILNGGTASTTYV